MSLLRMAHLSDSHFGTVLPGVQDGLLKTLNQLQPDLVILTGDITQRARKKQFQQARKFSENFKNFIAVPGNHDLPVENIFDRFLSPYRSYQKYFKALLEGDHIQGNIAVSCLNSTSRWRQVQGEFNLGHLEKRLQKKAPQAKIRIVAFHHPMNCAKPQDEKNLLINREPVMTCLQAHGVDLILGGHIHDPSVTLSKSRYPQAPGQMIVGVAGTCLSWRTRPPAPNSFNWIEADTSSDTPKLTFTRYDQRKDLSFTPEKVYQFVRQQPQRWEKVGH